jgi:hypothetical protein
MERKRQQQPEDVQDSHNLQALLTKEGYDQTRIGTDGSHL